MSLAKWGGDEMWREGIGERRDVLEDEVDGLHREGVHGGWRERERMIFIDCRG